MPTIARCVDIAVSAEQAFEFMAEISNMSKFHEGISDLHLISDKGRGLGLQFGCKVDVPRKGLLDCEYEVTDFIDYILIAIKTTSGPKSEGIWHFARMAGMNVKTRITYTLNYQVSVPIIGQLIDLVFVRRIWTERVEQTMQNLKDVLEKEKKTE
jgi:ribosome-associated toxin RatA of RatAB toxin-antitoxin module